MDSIRLSALLLGLAAPAAAQQLTISGIVADSATQIPLAGIHVHYGRAFTITDAQGRFVIARLSPGRDSLIARHAGHRQSVIESVPAGARDVRLLMAALPVPLDPLVVSVARVEQSAFDAPASVSVIDGGSARERVTATVADQLRAVPGVDMASKGLLQSTYAMRGFLGAASDAVLVMTDYRPAAVPSLRFNIPYLVPGTADDIERIEVQRGPGAALYGPGADRGVVHVITRSPFVSRGSSISIASGARGTTDVSGRFARAWRRVGFRISGSWFRGRDWSFADTTAALPPHRDAERATGDARLDWRLGARTEAIFAAGLASALRVADLTPAGPYQLRDWRNGYVQARLQRGASFLNAALNITDAGGSYSLQTGDTVRDNSRQLTLQAQRGLLGGSRSLIIGADARWTDPRTFGTINGAFENDDLVRENGLFATFSQSLARTVELTAALRADHHNRLDGLAWSPRLGVVLKPRTGQAIRLTYNRAFVAPSTTTLFADFVAQTQGPYGLRVAGIPRGGFTFRSGCGGPCMRSPLDPSGAGTWLSADAPGAWDGLVALLQSQGIDISAVPRPTGTDVGSALLLGSTPVTGLPAPVPANDRELTDVLELGYKAVVGTRTLITADLHHTRVSNVIQTLAPVTPLLFLDAASLENYLTPYVGTGNAQQIAAAAAPIPFGTVSPEQATHPTDILLASRQGGSYSLWGADLAVESQISARLLVTLSWAWASRDSAPGIALGIPRQKASGSVAWRSRHTMIEVRGRALRSHPVASGVYGGRVRGYAVADITAGRQLARFNITLSGSNLLNARHREFPGGPFIGRMMLVRLKAEF